MSFRRRLAGLGLVTAVVLAILLWGPLRNAETSAYDSSMLVHRVLEGDPGKNSRVMVFGIRDQSQPSGPPPLSDAEVFRRLEGHGAACVYYQRELLQGPDSRALREAVARSAVGLTGTGATPLKPPVTAAPSGLVVDPDGLCREVWLAGPAPATVKRPAVGLLLFARLEGVRPDAIVFGHDQILVGSIRIPTDSDYRLPIDFPGATRAAGFCLPYTDLTRGWKFKTPSGKWKFDRKQAYRNCSGRAVLIGPTPYSGRYEVATPRGKMMPVQAQVCVLDTLLRGWYLRRVPSGVDVLVFLALTAGVAWVCAGVRPLAALGVWLAGSSLFVAASMLAFWAGWQVDVTVPLFGLLVAFLVAVAGQLARAAGWLQKFVGGRAGSAMDLGGREKVATILFTNLPDHLKHLEEAASPEAQRLREQFTELLTEVVDPLGGRVLDYQGDAQMVGFGVDRDDPDHAVAAVRAGLALTERVHQLVGSWTGEARGDQSFAGVCTGPVAVGFVGAEQARALAAIGDTTNVAARLLGAARKLGVAVLISEPTYQAATDRIDAEPRPPVELKGKTHPVAVYAARSVTDRSEA